LGNTAIVVALLVGIAVWFAVASRLTAKPWDNRAQAGDVGVLRTSPQRIGLWVFMAVVTSLFTLFLTAYSIRMHHSVGCAT
jgi:cytochrome c oxidase subunit 3